MKLNISYPANGSQKLFDIGKRETRHSGSLGVAC
jgi:hypothetical protein